MPIVLLTSNNSRELTEALKRRCLYLWIDYPELEHELEIVRLHAPELDERVARRLVEVVGMVRDLDLKKPPSIAESIDWARALLLLGAHRHRRQDLHRHDVDHHQAPHRPGHRHRTGRREARPAAGQPRCRLCGLAPRAARRTRAAPRAAPRCSAARRRASCPAAWPRTSWSSARSCAARASPSARASCSTRSAPSPRSSGPSPRRSARCSPRRSPSRPTTSGSSTSSSTASSSAPPSSPPSRRAYARPGRAARWTRPARS